nr:glycyl-radical enzyme activating protein [Candidatus Sigynarchaeota archaeon]
MVNDQFLLICDIKQNSLDDGPGIRTVIFLKGCPLACVWCQNPEAQDSHQQLVFQREKCICCRSCVACPSSAIAYPPIGLNRTKCNVCLACVDACPAGVFKAAGKVYDVPSILRLARENRTFYSNSGGGITLSGGEPLLHPDFVLDLTSQLKAEGFGVVLETSGNAKLTAMVKQVLGNMQLIYYDVKFIDGKAHEQYTGAGNELILKNLESIVKEGLAILPESKDALDFKKHPPTRPLLVPRVPLIPGITATVKNLKEIAAFFATLNVSVIDVLPYNPLWLKKMETLGLASRYSEKSWMSKKDLAEVRETLKNFQFERFK